MIKTGFGAPTTLIAESCLYIRADVAELWQQRSSAWVRLFTAQTQYVLRIADLPTLATFDATGYPDRTEVTIIDSMRRYFLDRTSTLTPGSDDVDVIAAAGTGGGNWVGEV